MASRIEDYALIGDLESAALVSRDGSIDWLCMPRFDSPACFAALLGDEENGYWSLRPQTPKSSTRRYQPDTLVLETLYEAEDGAVTVVDFMPLKTGDHCTRVVRLARGEHDNVRMQMELAIRFDYGSTVPWVRRSESGITALSGPNALRLETPVGLVGRDFRTYADFSVAPGEVVPFLLTYHSSLEQPDSTDRIEELCPDTIDWWRDWTKTYAVKSEWREPVLRSLITLKALTHAPTGGIVAAPTTSLPEAIGGPRNWDYR